MSNKRLGVTLDADVAGLRRGLNLGSLHMGQFAKESEAAMDRASVATERARNTIANMARSAVGILAFGKIIGQADEVGQLQSRLEQATKSTAEFTAVQDRLVEASERTYRRLEGGVEVYTRTAKSLQQLGFESQDAADLVATMQYGLTISAAGADKTASAVDALSKSILLGKVGMDQYTAIMNASPRLAQAMADALGVTNAQLMDMVRTNGLTVQQLMQVTTQMQVLGAEADKMRTSVADALGRGFDRLGRRINELNNATGATDALVAGIDLVTSHLDKLALVGGVLAGGYLVHAFGNISRSSWEAAKAMRAQAAEAAALRPATVALASASLAAAEADAIKARSATAAASASFAAARGSAQEAVAAQALVAARRAEAVADQNAAAAKAAVTAASGGLAGAARGVLGFLGGPVGLAVTTGLVATGLLTMSSSARAATPDIDALSSSVEKLNKEQLALRRQQVDDLLVKYVEEAKAAADALSGLERDQAALQAAFERGAGVTQEGLQNVNRALVEQRAAVADANQKVSEARALQTRFAEAADAAAGATDNLAGSARALAAGMAETDWAKYIKDLTDARDVIGLTAEQLGRFQARAKGANDEQAALAGIISAQTDAYKTLEKAIENKDAKAKAGAIKILDDLAKQEAATAALTARTATMAKLQAEIAAGMPMVYASMEADFAAGQAHAAALAGHAARINAITTNTTPGSGRGAGRTSETEGQKMLKSINDRIIALKVEALSYGDVSQAQKELIEFEQRLLTTKNASLKQSAATVRARLAEEDALIRSNKAAQRGRDMQKAYADSILDANASLYESYLQMQDQVSTWAVNDRDAVRNMELLEQARIRERLATEQQVLWRQIADGESAKEIQYSVDIVNGLTRQLEVRQQLAALGDTAYNQAEVRRQVEAQAEGWGKVLDGLRENFQDGFFAALGDRTALSAFSDNLKRSAKTALASAAYEAFAKPIFVRIVADLAGLTGGASVRDQVLRQAGMGGDVGGNGSSLLSSAARWADTAMFNGAGALPGSVAYANWACQGGGDALGALIGANPQWGMSGVGSWFANAPASSMFSLGGVNSATGLSTAAGGAMTAGAGIVGGLVGGAMFGNKGQSALGGGLGASAGMMVGTSAAVGGTAIGAQLGMAAGPIGAAIGMIAGAALGSVIGAAEKRFGGGYTVGSDGNYFRSGGPSGGDPNEAASIATVSGVRDSVRELARVMGGDASGLSFAGGWELSPDKGRSFVFSDWAQAGQDLSWERGKRDLSGVKDGEVVAAEFAAEMQRALLRGLQLSRLDAIYADYIGGFDVSGMDAAGVQQVLASLDAIQRVGALGDVLGLPALADASAATRLRIAELTGGIEGLEAASSAYVERYYTEAERQAFATQQVTDALSAVGVVMPTLEGSAREMLDSYRALVEAQDINTDAGAKAFAALMLVNPAFAELAEAVGSVNEAVAGERLGLETRLLQLQGDTVTLRQRELAALDPSNRAIQERIWALEDERAAATDVWQGQFDLVQRLTAEASRLDSVLAAAGTVLDRIGAALGRGGQHGPAREAEMWARLTTASYEQQLELARQLADTVLERVQAEQAAAQAQIDALSRQRELARGLGQYFDSLRTGDMSPLTLGQRVAESERQLTEAVAKARGGDEQALGQVQQLTEQALRLWREYGASGNDYQDAYNRLTGMVGDLASKTLSEAERQIALHEQAIGISDESRAQLERLYGVAERARAEVQVQYAAAMQASRNELAVLTSVASNTGRLNDVAGLLQGMPAGIAAALQPVLSAAMGNVVSGWYANAGYGQGDQAGRDYWTGQLGNKPAAQVQQDFLTAIVKDWYKGALGWDQPDSGGLAYWVAEAQRIGATAAHADFMHAVGIHGSHRDGLWSVPFDGYNARLHAGETVLPEPEARRYRALDAMPDWSQYGRQDSAALIAEIRRLNDRVAQLETAVVAAVDRNAGSNARATSEAADAIRDGVGDAIQQRQRDDTNNRQAQRAGIYTTT